jgi:hypothetical protein
MGYIQQRVIEVLEWAKGTVEGNGVWKAEGVTRRFKPRAIYIYIMEIH